MTIKTLQYLYLAAFVMIFFTDFVIFIIPNTAVLVRVAVFLLLILFFILVIFNNKKILDLFKKIYNTANFKSYLILIIYILISAFLNILSGKYLNMIAPYFVRIMDIINTCMFLYLLIPMCTILNIKFKTMIKIFYFMIFFAFVFGIVEYVAQLCSFTPFQFLQNIYLNFKTQFSPENMLINCFDDRRIMSIFDEPSALGQFIFIFMPFTINLSYSKYKLFENMFFNKLIKISIVPLMLINLILTKSPMYLVLGIIEFVILIMLKNKRFLLQNFKYILLGLVLVLFISLTGLILLSDTFISVNISDLYLGRILKVMESLGSLDKLIQLEASLATRIISYANQFLVFIHNPLIGCGLCNIDMTANKQVLNSPLPLTPELMDIYYKRSFSMSYAKSLVFTGLAEFGFLGAICYINFIYKNIIGLFNCIKKTFAIEHVFVASLFQSIIMLSIISFYNMTYSSIFLWFIYGLILMSVIYIKKRAVK